MATRTGERGIIADLRFDLKRFHERWMGIVYPRQVGAEGTVLGKWRPRSRSGLVWYRVWAVIGVPVVAVLYPLALLGAFLRFYSRRIDGLATSIGVIGVVVLSAIAWGLLAFVARMQFPYQGFVAVVASGIVATVSALGAIVFARIDGRATTVLLAYPLAMTAIFLPPVVAALFSPTVADTVLPRSYNLAVWLLDGPLSAVGVATYLRETFELVGLAYLAMWFSIAVPLGWLLGGLVTLADVARPRNRRRATR